MLMHPLLDKLEALRFRGMARALRDQLAQPDIESMPFTERLGLLIDHEAVVREDARLQSRLRRAGLRMNACMEDIHYRDGRGLDKRLLLHLANGNWIRRHQNIIITGPTGVGKSYIACALAHKACMNGFTARHFRLSRLLDAMATARAEGRYLRMLKTLARLDVLLIDDWGLQPISTEQQQDLLEIFDDRYQQRSTIVTRQLPVQHWHEIMKNPTLADAIIDRLVHTAHRIKLAGESMRKRQSVNGTPNTPTHENAENKNT